MTFLKSSVDWAIVSIWTTLISIPTSHVVIIALKECCLSYCCHHWRQTFFLKSNFRRVVKMYILFCFYDFFRPIFVWNYLMQCLFVILVIQAKTRNNTFSGSWYWNLAAFASTAEPSGKINFTVTVRGEVLAMVKHISRPSTGLH